MKFFETSQLQQWKFGKIVMRQIQTTQDAHITQSAVQRLQLIITKVQLTYAHCFSKIIVCQLQTKTKINKNHKKHQTQRTKLTNLSLFDDKFSFLSLLAFWRAPFSVFILLFSKYSESSIGKLRSSLGKLSNLLLAACISVKFTEF